MQENKFENRVQQQMEELRIRPSETVWQKVEEELRKKKKRRIVFYLFLLAGLTLLGYAGYFLSDHSTSNLVQQTISVSRGTDKSIKDNNQLPSIENSTSNSQQSKKENQLSFDKKSNSAATNDIVLNDKEIRAKENFVVKKHKRSAIKNTAGKTLHMETIYKDNVVIKNNLLQSREKTSLQKEDSEIPVISKVDISHPIVAEIKLKEFKDLSASGETIQIKKDSLSEAVIVKNEEIPAAKKKLRQSSKINWGIELSVGISSYKDNVFSIYDGQKSLIMDYNSSPNSAGGGPQTIIYSPSSIRSGPAFRSGIVAELKISKKSSISSGLRYAYYSNRIQVGTYTNTIGAISSSTSSLAGRADVFYRGVQQKEYSNHFHFMQLPLQYQLQLNKGIKLPITWNAGLTTGYLFTTNGLVYDTAASGIYFHNNDAFNKVQFNLNTGFSFRFGNKSKVQWSLGPELSLGLNKLMKSDFIKKQYLLYSGITGRIIFTKKK